MLASGVAVVFSNVFYGCCDHYKQSVILPCHMWAQAHIKMLMNEDNKWHNKPEEEFEFMDLNSYFQLV